VSLLAIVYVLLEVVRWFLRISINIMSGPASTIVPELKGRSCGLQVLGLLPAHRHLGLHFAAFLVGDRDLLDATPHRLLLHFSILLVGLSKLPISSW